ncbi:MAG: DUF4298 domain-containing protein [Clostridia bacterium]|nr:DUF4298 domain-containing protein [Clostridia bacterium]
MDYCQSGELDAAVDRITYMESAYTRAEAQTRRLADALSRYAEMLPEAKALSEYYGGEAWYADRALDERGQIPEDLKRGVLAEDTLYNWLGETRELALTMLETATRILKDL